MKKYSKILLTLFFAFFASINVVSAKEMTIEEFGKLFNETNPDASYVYVIGEYAFTSKHILTTQAAMIAARTRSSHAVSFASSDISSLLIP